MSKKSKKQLTDWAYFRFSIIGGLLAKPPDKGELGKEIEKLASSCYVHPTKDAWITFGTSTIERWYYRALGSNDPIKALSRKIRSDAGKTIAMSPDLLAALKQQYAKYQHWSYQLHTDNLEALVEIQPKLGSMPSYSTVVRRMKERGTKKLRAAAIRHQGRRWLKSALSKGRCVVLSPPMCMPCGTWTFIKDGVKWWIQMAFGIPRRLLPCWMTVPGFAIISSGILMKLRTVYSMD